MSLISAKKLLLASGSRPGQAEFTIPGTYQWKCPPGVTRVCAVAIGGGGRAGTAQAASGGGGGLGWKNGISVVPGQTYTVVVGRPGYIEEFAGTPKAGGVSYFIIEQLVAGGGGFGLAADAAGFVGDGGGFGGRGAITNQNIGYPVFAGDAGNYTGAGLDGGYGQGGRGGYGTGLVGTPSNRSGVPVGQGGGRFGGGSGISTSNATDAPGGGAVRIIWGAGRAFPSTKTGDV